MTVNSIFSCIPLILRDGSPALIDIIDIDSKRIIGITTDVRPGEFVTLLLTGEFAGYLDTATRRAS